MKRKGLILGCLAMVLAVSGCGNRKEVFELAEDYLEVGDYSEALNAYAKAIAGQEKLVDSFRGAGISCLKMGDYSAAISYFDNALAQEEIPDEKHRDIIQYKITAYYRNADYDDALRCCEELNEFPMDKQSYYLRACVELAKNQYDAASADFQSAFQEDPSLDFALDIYQVYMDRGMEADGNKYLEASLKTEADSAEDYYKKGQVYHYLKQYDDAIKCLSQAAKGGEYGALLEAAQIFMEQGNSEEARKMYENYASKVKNKASSYNGLAMCDINEGNYTSALENLEKAAETADPEELPDILFNQMVVYERMRDYTSAQAKVQEYLNLCPYDEAAKKEAAFLASRIQEANESIVEEPVEEVEETEEEYEYDNSYNSYGSSYGGYYSYGNNYGGY